MTNTEPPTDSDTPEELSFDEFRLYYESTERVTDRRLDTNRWNYSISLAVLVAIGALTNWAIVRKSFFVVGLTGSAALAVMAVFFTSLWIKQITDFKALNAAKFAVLNQMAPRLVFPSSDVSVPRRSYCPFEREWSELQRARAISQVRGTKVVGLALNSSNSEYYVPKALRVMFAGILLAICVVATTNWHTVEASVRCLTGNVSSTRCR